MDKEGRTRGCEALRLRDFFHLPTGVVSRPRLGLGLFRTLGLGLRLGFRDRSRSRDFDFAFAFGIGLADSALLGLLLDVLLDLAFFLEPPILVPGCPYVVLLPPPRLMMQTLF